MQVIVAVLQSAHHLVQPHLLQDQNQVVQVPGVLAQGDQVQVAHLLADHHLVVHAVMMSAQLQEVVLIVQSVIAMTSQSQQRAISVVNGQVNVQKQVMIAEQVVVVQVVHVHQVAGLRQIVHVPNVQNDLDQIAQEQTDHQLVAHVVMVKNVHVLIAAMIAVHLDQVMNAENALVNVASQIDHVVMMIAAVMTAHVLAGLTALVVALLIVMNVQPVMFLKSV
jgi:hypothetical protein